MYTLETARVVKEVRRRKAKRILLQLPDGLKRYALTLARAIEEKTNATVILSGGHCFGACDLAVEEAGSLGSDLIVHYGHTPWKYGKTIPSIYVDARSEVSIKKPLRKTVRLLKGIKKVGLAAPIQFIHKLREAKELLENEGKEVLIGRKRGDLSYDGQITGCNYASSLSVAEYVDAFIVLGGGTFHALGLALTTGKKTLLADPYLGNVVNMDQLRKKILKQRWAIISKARNYNSFGIVIGLKVGQRRIRESMEIKERLERHGKNSTIISISNVENNALLPFEGIDAFVNTACPRVAIDDLALFSKPMLIPAEIDVVLKETSWDADHPLRVNDYFWLKL